MKKTCRNCGDIKHTCPQCGFVDYDINKLWSRPRCANMPSRAAIREMLRVVKEFARLMGDGRLDWVGLPPDVKLSRMIQLIDKTEKQMRVQK